jgi:hypothetical protein
VTPTRAVWLGVCLTLALATIIISTPSNLSTHAAIAHKKVVYVLKHDCERGDHHSPRYEYDVMTGEAQKRAGFTIYACNNPGVSVAIWDDEEQPNGYIPAEGDN